MLGQVNNGTFEKLAKSYNKMDYENCLFKAIDYTYSDKTKKEPEPYLYIAMCYYELSLSEEPYIQEDYPKALKDAIKYLVKFKKKDKTKEMYNQNLDNINKIIDTYYEEANEFYKLESYKKAAYNYGQLANLEDSNYDLLFIQGVCYALVNNNNGIMKSFRVSIPEMHKLLAENSIKVNSKIKSQFLDAFIKYADYLIENDETDSATSTLTLGTKVLPSNSVLSDKLKELSNEN